MDIITIGSDSTCNVCINKSVVAGRHCIIKKNENGTYSVSNLNPNYETRVNGEKVENEKTFECIDTMLIGDVLLTWEDLLRDAEDDTKRLQEFDSGAIQKKRHGFVTFWLWMGIITNIILIPVQIVVHQHLTNPGGYYLMGLITAGMDVNPIMEKLHHHVLILQFVSVIGAIMMVIFNTKLLHWKKSGFWGIVCTSVTVNIISLIMFKAIEQDYLGLGLTIQLAGIVQIFSTVFGVLVSLLVLWAVLQIKGCWKQLE